MLSERVKHIEYPIRDVIIEASKIEKQGKKIYHLNIGDPNKFDFGPPQHVKQAYIDAIKKGYANYAPSEGDPELLQELARIYKVSQDNVVITMGVSEGINFLLGSIVNAGENILLPSPSYSPYNNFTIYYGGMMNFYECDEKWHPIPEDIRKKINKKTKAIVIINPNNPTGAVYPRKVVKEIMEIAGEHNLLAISDEIYNGIFLEECDFCSANDIASDVPLVIANGFSKAHLCTGYRVGYLVFRNADEIKEGVLKLCRMRLSMNYPAQKAMLAALRGGDKHTREMVRKLKRRGELAHKMLNEIEGIHNVKASGAFYVFPRIESKKWKNDREFVYGLLKSKGVLTVFGSGFSPVLKHMHFRLVFLPPEEMLSEAIEKIKEYVEE